MAPGKVFTKRCMDYVRKMRNYVEVNKIQSVGMFFNELSHNISNSNMLTSNQMTQCNVSREKYLHSSGGVYFIIVFNFFYFGTPIILIK